VRCAASSATAAYRAAAPAYIEHQPTPTTTTASTDDYRFTTANPGARLSFSLFASLYVSKVVVGGKRPPASNGS